MTLTLGFDKFADRLAIVSKSSEYFNVISSFTGKKPEVSLGFIFLHTGLKQMFNLAKPFSVPSYD